MKKKIAIIGSGFSGLSAAAYCAQKGYEVHVFEKNSQLGGRARQFSTDNGYVFDMGPSWYWMPDVIESFFTDFGTSTKSFFELVSLDPQFKMVFENDTFELPSNYSEMKALFESYEPNAGNKLDQFMEAAFYKYEVGMKNFVHKPCLSISEFASLKIAKSAWKLDLLSDFRSYVSKYFKHPYLQTIMEFPVIFLGASPKQIPALYSMLNYGGYKMGTWYPMGGFYELVKAMAHVGENAGVTFHLESPVEKIVTNNNEIKNIIVNGKSLSFDYVIGSADYHHVEKLLDDGLQNYSEKYWSSRTFAPSCLLFYVGINKKIPNIKHHTLFFEKDLDQHIDEIYVHKKWPKDPLFYVCCPSKSDPNVAPEGHENLFILMPLATGIEDTEELREKYFDVLLKRIEKISGVEDISSSIDFKRSYCITDFISDYNAYAGNAYGLANTLKQTAILKPSIKNKKIKNLFYTGQLTVPGPGIPPSIISGKIIANQL